MAERTAKEAAKFVCGYIKAEGDEAPDSVVETYAKIPNPKDFKVIFGSSLMLRALLAMLSKNDKTLSRGGMKVYLMFSLCGILISACIRIIGEDFGTAIRMLTEAKDGLVRLRDNEDPETIFQSVAVGIVLGHCGNDDERDETDD